MAHELPRFDNGETYLLTGETLNAIMDWLNENRIVIVAGSGLKVDEVGPQGTKISIDGTDVCP
jgi:hypothetical protein